MRLERALLQCIQQAIKNLVINAIKFSPVISKVIIQAKEDKNRIGKGVVILIQ